jgi:hypothetical protein
MMLEMPTLSLRKRLDYVGSVDKGYGTAEEGNVRESEAGAGLLVRVGVVVAAVVGGGFVETDRS